LTARWLDADEPKLVKEFSNAYSASMAEDHNGLPVFLPRNAWHLEKSQKDFPAVRLLKTREQVQ
jgi:peptide chain release factor 3